MVFRNSGTSQDFKDMYKPCRDNLRNDKIIWDLGILFSPSFSYVMLNKRRHCLRSVTEAFLISIVSFTFYISEPEKHWSTEWISTVKQGSMQLLMLCKGGITTMDIITTTLDMHLVMDRQHLMEMQFIKFTWLSPFFVNSDE